MAVTLLDAMPVLSLRTNTSLLEDVPITPLASGKGWACDTGEHTHHRKVEKARWCAWRALPMESVSWRGIEGSWGPGGTS